MADDEHGKPARASEDCLVLRPYRRDHLVIGSDTGFEDEPLAVLLFTPDMADTGEHHHIELELPQARMLHDWLMEFLRKNGGLDG